MKAKVGDVVHISGVVLADEGAYRVDFDSIGTWHVGYDAIVHVEPAPLKVGDVVKRNGQPFTIISTLNNVAWLRDELGYITADLGDLERVPDEPYPPTHYTVNWKPSFG